MSFMNSLKSAGNRSQHRHPWKEELKLHQVLPKAKVGMPDFARGTVEFVVISLWCFGTLVNVEAL